jgi:hypothetical protein
VPALQVRVRGSGLRPILLEDGSVMIDVLANEHLSRVHSVRVLPDGKIVTLPLDATPKARLGQWEGDGEDDGPPLVFIK